MDSLNQREWVIGLHDYDKLSKHPQVFSAFHDFVLGELEGLGLALTFVGIEGDGYSGKATKANGAAYKRVRSSNFAGISVLTLLSNPKGSNQPAYDRFFSASLGITPHDDNILTFCVNEGILRFGSDGFHRILTGVANLHEWTTGYAFVDQSAKQPEFHVLGLDDGNLTAEGHERLTKWYASKREDKATRIRSVYPFNLLNGVQLEQPLSNVQTIREFARSHRPSQLISESFGSLSLWMVPETEMAAIRKLFEGCNAVIAL